MTTPRHEDFIIEARWMVPIEPAGIILENHAIFIQKGRIADIFAIDIGRARHPDMARVQLPHHVLMPGLVNTHAHTAMSLLRGIADDLPLMRWLREAIWPRESKHVSDSFVYEGTLLGGAEMLRGGITCVNDLYFYPDASARAYDALGMRAQVGMTVIDFPTPYASDVDDYLRKGLAARDAWVDSSRIGFFFAPHAPYTVSDASLERIRDLAEQLDANIHIHLHETANEISDAIQRDGIRPLARLQALGLLGPNLSIAHAVHMTDNELRTLADARVGVAHNPTSNMKLASGIAPVARMVATGIHVGLGTDGAASNNRLDMFQEMRHAALLAKVSTGDAAVLPAHQVLRMATLDGAHILGLQDQIGSIEIGKFADLCAISVNNAFHQPYFDPASHLIYVVGREEVTDVWVDGIRRVQDGTLLHPHNKELMRISGMWQNSLKA
ncbi:TRZ/ATZ family hydrolase [Uliginosibacterium sp. sgz301328]|uniref:TRZ/ATZ family hydrolase n=1 Tax=Uliginosibacterium sp. sgz301328 TaxID=3243764 RepID=UPI00359EF0D7